MPKIYELDRHVADLIAAGEVVERPASVIKELMENSIDAGARVITTEIKSGGMTYIRVTDDGCGIAPADAATAFLRHATSKLRSAGELDAIATLGFRGEALAAISSVSKIEMLTREQGADEGVRLTVEAGEITDISPFGCPEGTTLIVRDLFYNTPARQKFMKTDRAEGSGAYSAALRCALSHPEVSVRFIKDGKTECHTPGDFRIDSCLYSLFGRDFALGLIPAQTEDEHVSVAGFVSHPSAARGNRSYQFFFVNGRHIRSRTLQAALEKAYTNTLTTGKFPACALYITTRHCDVDVNVHPAKTEVRFISDSQIFNAVYYAALGAIERAGISAGIGELSVQQPQQPPQDTRRERAAVSFAPEPDGAGFGRTADIRAKTTLGGGFKSAGAEGFRKTYSPGSFKTAVPPVPDTADAEPVKNEDRVPYQTRFAGNADGFFGDYGGEIPRVVGETMNTYIIAELGQSVWFIDKHAAHERICFDKLQKGHGAVMSQTLITPVICRQDAEDTQQLLDNAQMLEELGFIIESFGDDAIAVRGMPEGIEQSDAEQVLSEICMQLRRTGIAQPGRRDGVLKTVACKAAVRAGESSDIHELEELARRVFSGEVRYCPHGRPVAFELTKSSLERSFKRS